MGFTKRILVEDMGRPYASLSDVLLAEKTSHSPALNGECLVLFRSGQVSKAGQFRNSGRYVFTTHALNATGAE